MSMFFAYMAGGVGMVGRGFKMFCQRGPEFFLLALCMCMCVCVCVCRGGREFQVQYISFREKNNRPPSY